MKICVKCGETERYKPRPENPVGECKFCTRRRMSKRQERKRQEISAYQKHRYHSNSNYKTTKLLRCRLRDILRDSQKTGSAIKDLGCSVNELKIHLEKQFQSGMTWENQGTWHIDHIIPLSKFDLNDREQFLKACHYSNLQPLWATDNIKKSNKY